MHKWEVTATQDEESFFDDHIETIIASDEVLPPREQSLGETAVRWDRVGKDAFIQAQGGSVDDRILARALVAEQLREFGIREAEYSFDDMRKEAMPAQPDWWSQYVAQHPYAYHGTHADDASIMQHGLLPWDHPANTEGSWQYADTVTQPRPGHVYMSTSPSVDDYSRVWRVDLRQLNPQNVNPDEDWYSDAGKYGPTHQWDEARIEPWEERKPEMFGDTAERLQFGQIPEHTHHSIDWGKFAHRGVIPPAALSVYDPAQPMAGDWVPPAMRAAAHLREAHFEKTAEWNDIMDKARRLIQDGKVRILRNGYNNVVGYVKGDHGEYQPEIFRQDPNSRAITMSDCGCGWGEFQNQPRTRQWKRYQDRPCSHILATYWLAQATPLDEDAHPAMGDQGASQPQGQPGAEPGAMPPGGPQGAPQGVPAPMGPQQGIPPVSQPGIPPQGGPSPADVLPQFQTEPPDIQPQNPSSVPGLRGPTPTNPINYPPGPGGTFSSWQPLRQGKGLDVVAFEIAESNGQVWLAPSDVINRDHHVGGVSEGDEQTWFEVGRAHVGNRTDDLASQSVIEGVDIHGWRVAADDTLPEVPEQDPRLTAPLVNGQMVQLRYPDTGIQQGRSEAHGAGQQTQLPAGLVGEVLGTDPTTGMVSVLYVGKPWEQNREFEPFGATGEHWRSYLIHRPDVKRPGPAYRRTR